MIPNRSRDVDTAQLIGGCLLTWLAFHPTATSQALISLGQDFVGLLGWLNHLTQVYLGGDLAILLSVIGVICHWSAAPASTTPH